MTRKEAKRLDDLICKSLAKEREYVEGARDNTNPCVVEITNRSKGAIAAYEACLDALRGDFLMLNISAGGRLDCQEVK